MIRQLHQSVGLQRGMLVAGLVLSCVFLLTAIFAPLLAPYGFNQLRDAVRPVRRPAAAVVGAPLRHDRRRLRRPVPGDLGLPDRARTSSSSPSSCRSSSACCSVWCRGYFGGWLDRVLVVICDAIYAFPSLLLAIVIAIVISGGQSSLWGGIFAAAISITVIYVPQYFRVVRAEVVRIKAEAFVESAKVIGAGHWRIMTRHVFRNSTRTLPLIVTLNASEAISTLVPTVFLSINDPPLYKSLPSLTSIFPLHLSLLLPHLHLPSPSPPPPPPPPSPPSSPPPPPLSSPLPPPSPSPPLPLSPLPSPLPPSPPPPSPLSLPPPPPPLLLLPPSSLLPSSLSPLPPPPPPPLPLLPSLPSPPPPPSPLPRSRCRRRRSSRFSASLGGLHAGEHGRLGGERGTATTGSSSGGGTASPRRRVRSRGSARSLRLSPTRVRPRMTSTIAVPGKIDVHQIPLVTSARDLFRSKPHSAAAVGSMPKPRKPRAASVEIASEALRVRISGRVRVALRSTCRAMIRQWPAPMTIADSTKGLGLDPDGLGPDHPEVLRDEDDGDRDGRGQDAAPQARLAAADDDRHDDGQQQRGEGVDGVGDQHQDAVQPAAEVARQQAEEHPGEDRERAATTTT